MRNWNGCGEWITGYRGFLIRNGVGGTKTSVCICSKFDAAILGNMLFRDVYEEVGSDESGCSSRPVSPSPVCVACW